MVKFSILAQYYRIFAVKKFRMATIAVGLFVFAYTIICVFVNVGYLVPRPALALTDLPGLRMPQQALARMGPQLP